MICERIRSRSVKFNTINGSLDFSLTQYLNLKDSVINMKVPINYPKQHPMSNLPHRRELSLARQFQASDVYLCFNVAHLAFQG